MIKRTKFGILFLLVPEVIFIILYGIFVEYDVTAGGIPYNQTESQEFQVLYPMFQDVHVMIFIGFGFLMTFLKRYGFGSVGFNLLLSAFVIQWAIFIRGTLDLHGFADGKIQLTLDNFLNADFCCGSVLISFGAVLGVLSPTQLIVMATFEVVFYAVNELVIIEYFKISDIGGSLAIHAFGAYFGLGVSFFHWKEELKNNPKNGSKYHSDLFAMIGTLFLWLFWPSFNGAPAAGTLAGERAVVNTIYSLSAACVSAFALSSVFEKSGKFSMVHVQNATLAGGVAIGSVANLKMGLFGSATIGSIAGILSVIGYEYITPALQRSIKLHDTCGVHNLHGLPGLLSAIAAVIIANYTTERTFTERELGQIYPGLEESGRPQDFTFQAQMQLAGMAATLAISIAGGLITGYLLKFPFFDPVTPSELFQDCNYWQLPEDEKDSIKAPNTAAPAGDIKLEDKVNVVEEQTMDDSIGEAQHA